MEEIFAVMLRPVKSEIFNLEDLGYMVVSIDTYIDLIEIS